MSDTLLDMVAAAGRKKQRPDGTPYRSLSFKDQRDLAERCGVGQRQVQLAALRQDIVPEVYARNQKTLSNKDQIKLLKSHVAIIGLGGLGGTVTEILARIGIGHLTLVDGDCFDDSNLNRQLLSSVDVLGKMKADVAEQRVNAINPAVAVRKLTEFLNDDNAAEILSGCDIGVDCLDSITTRFVLERACRQANIPMVSAAIGGTSGQVSVIYPGDPGLMKIYGDPAKASNRGIEKTLGTLPFAAIAMASMQCAEVVSIAIGREAGLRNRLLITDLFDHSLDVVELG